MKMENKKRVLEALQIQPLSEEEKASRHILGRLYGPIATCKESTRNGRFYNKSLWEKALQDDIFNEKLNTKALFLELGHPADREETDMTKVCACIPEMPKIVDDDLYGCVDILDTPNGRILKTLCDYGFVPGISSRGSGDLLSNNIVDPETFLLETWDIVQLPAVKKARLTVCESFDTKNQKLKKALVESLNEADDADKKIMQETLNNLNIDVKEQCDKYPGGTPKNIEDIPESCDDKDDDKAVLNEEADDEEITDREIENVERVAGGEAEDELGMTIGRLLDYIKDIDKDTDVEITAEDNGDDTFTVVIGAADNDNNSFGFGTTFSYDEIKAEDENKEADEPVADVKEETEEKTETEEADDVGDEEEVIESLKEAIRQKTALEKEAKALKETNAVSDAKVKELQESLDKYRAAFERTSVVASRANKLSKKVKSLSEQLSTKEKLIEQLNKEISKAKTLAESTSAKATASIKSELTSVQETNDSLQESLKQSEKAVAERTKIAKKYQAKYFEAINRYIDSKATMLGISAKDIKSKLNEGFTMDDIDKVCDDLLDKSATFTRLPFGTPKVRVNESKVQKAPTTKKVDSDCGYEIDDSLLELAGLANQKF